MGGIILKDRVLGGLSVTRAFGDTHYKPYVIAEPEIIEYKLSGKDEFLIIGSDGYWNVFYFNYKQLIYNRHMESKRQSII